MVALPRIEISQAEYRRCQEVMEVARRQPLRGQVDGLPEAHFAGLRLEMYENQQQPDHAEVLAIRLGDAALVGLPGEVFCEIGMEIRRGSPAPHTLVAGLADDAVGYLPTRESFAQGGYEVTVGSTFYQPGAAERLGRGGRTTTAAVRRLENLHPRSDTMANDKVNFGVIGAGGIAYRKTIPGMLKAKNCRLVAVMDTVNVDRIAGELGVRGYAAEAELLANPEIQAVYIASPANCHAKQIRMAARAGKHVLCEKPLTMSLKQTEAAVEECRRRQVFLQEGYMMKFHGAHAKIKQLIDEGKLGKIVYMRAQLSCWYPKIAAPGGRTPSSAAAGP